MRRRRTALWPLAGVAFVAAGLAAVWRTSDLGRAASDLDRQWAAAKAEGVPTEYADLHRLTPPITEARNAAPLYGDAFATFHKFGALKGVDTKALLKAIPAGNAKPEDLAKLRLALRDVSPALAQAHEGSRRPGFSLDQRWELSSRLTFPQYSDARSVATAMALRAMLATDPAAAADDLRTAALMRAHFGADPVIIASLVGNGIEGDVHTAARFVGAKGLAWAAALAPVLGDLGPIPALRRSLTGEAVWGMHFDEELARSDIRGISGMDGSSPPLIIRLMAFGPVRDASKERVVEYWRRAWARLPQNPTDFRAAREALRMPSNTGPSDALLEILLPVFEGFAEANARSEAGSPPHADGAGDRRRADAVARARPLRRGAAEGPARREGMDALECGSRRCGPGRQAQGQGGRLRLRPCRDCAHRVVAPGCPQWPRHRPQGTGRVAGGGADRLVQVLKVRHPSTGCDDLERQVGGHDEVPRGLDTLVTDKFLDRAAMFRAHEAQEVGRTDAHLDGESGDGELLLQSLHDKGLEFLQRARGPDRLRGQRKVPDEIVDEGDAPPDRAWKPLEGRVGLLTPKLLAMAEVGENGQTDHRGPPARG